jgi:hypothetical protein
MSMRTTLTIDDSIMKAAKQRAAQEGRPLKAVIGDALRLGLGLMRDARASKGKFKLTVVDGQGLQPGVRLDDRDALFDLMDGR